MTETPPNIRENIICRLKCYTRTQQRWSSHLHHRATPLLALLKIAQIICRYTAQVAGFPLYTLNLDILLPFHMPPAESLHLDRVDLRVVDAPFSTADRNHGLCIGKVKLRQVYLRCHLISQDPLAADQR